MCIRDRNYDAPRYERVARARQREQRLMLDYLDSDGCRMAFLQRTLDDPDPQPCGRCDRCAEPWYAAAVDPPAIESVRTELERVGVQLPPRVQWPTGMGALGVPLSGRIGAPEAALPGRRCV